VSGGDPKSQRRQTPSHARPLRATIVAARYHVGRLSAPSSHAMDFAYKRGVRRFKSYCAHFFSNICRCLSAEIGEPDKSEIYLACGARTVWYVDATSENHVCSHLGHGGDCMTAKNMANRREYNRVHGIASHRSPERSPTGSTGSLATR
jgi:hypothetical protein